MGLMMLQLSGRDGYYLEAKILRKSGKQVGGGQPEKKSTDSEDEGRERKSCPSHVTRYWANGEESKDRGGLLLLLSFI